MTMSKIAVVYWSGTGNTEQMAAQVAEGVRSAGGEAVLLTAAEFGPEQLSEYDAVAFGCPSMGAEQLEEDEFEPMFTACESSLSGKKLGLFGSYGWGDGQWMRDWQERTALAGADIVSGEGLMLNETPDSTGLEQCRELGKLLAE